MRKTLLVVSLLAVILLSAIPVKAQDDFEQVFDYVDNYFKDKLGGLIFPHNPIGESVWRRSTDELSRLNKITYENMDNLATTIKNFNPNVPTEPPDIKPYGYQSINDALETFLDPSMLGAYRTLNQLQETFQGKMNAVGDRLEEFRATARDALGLQKNDTQEEKKGYYGNPNPLTQENASKDTTLQTPDNEHYDKEARAQKVAGNEAYEKGEDAETISANNAAMQEEPAKGDAGEPESVHAGSKYWYDPNDKDHFINVVDENNTYHRMSLEDAVDKGLVPEGATIEDMTHYNNAKDSFENDVNTSDRFGNRQDRIDSTSYPDGNGMQTDTDGANSNYENMHASNINDEFQNELNNVNGNQNPGEKTPVEDKQHSSGAVDDEFQNELDNVAGKQNSSDEFNNTFDKETSAIVSLREEEAEREAAEEREAVARREAAEREAVARREASEREAEDRRKVAEYQKRTQDMQARRDKEEQAREREESSAVWREIGAQIGNSFVSTMNGINAQRQAKEAARIASIETENRRREEACMKEKEYQEEIQARRYRNELAMAEQARERVYKKKLKDEARRREEAEAAAREARRQQEEAARLARLIEEIKRRRNASNSAAQTPSSRNSIDVSGFNRYEPWNPRPSNISPGSLDYDSNVNYGTQEDRDYWAAHPERAEARRQEDSYSGNTGSGEGVEVDN